MPKSKLKKVDADTWLKNNLEYLVENFAGGYVVIVDNRGLVFSDADGPPREIVEKARAKFKGSIPLFFRVPHPQDFLCALIIL